MKKRFTAALLALIICCTSALAGCAGSETAAKTDGTSAKTETTAQTTAESKAETAAETTAESKAETTAESKTDSEPATQTEPAAERPTNVIDGVDYLVLASYGHRLPEDWEDTITIESFTNSQDYDVYVEKRAMQAYKELKEDLEKEDVHIDIDTGYRSVAEQEEITQRFRERYGLEYAKQYVAVPGYSEHQSALAIDLYLTVDGKDIIYNEDLVQYPEIWAKIHAKLADHGFILRYAEDKEDITKFSYEPWHIRYVGSPEIAKEITEKGLALEEYLGVTIEKKPDTNADEKLEPVNRETLYQVALLQSLVQGYYTGIISAAAEKERGDIGIGTFDGVNGELIMLDGEIYRAAADGTVEVVPDDEMIPFSNVTFFDTDGEFDIKGVKDIDSVKAELDKIVEENGRNYFYMVRIDGSFDKLKVRSEPKQEEPYKPLDEVLAAEQVEFDLVNTEGTVVALYCPNYMSGLNTAGWHLHFISSDRAKGGHVLGLSVGEAQVKYDITPGFRMYLSDSDEFQSLDLAKNVDKAIKDAETKTKD